MAVPTTTWSESTPAGSDNIAQGDDRIRELKTQVREVVAVDHEFTSTQTASTGGQHKQVTLQEQADLGTGAEGVPILGAQTSNGKAELFFTDEDDNDVQITKAGVKYPSQSTVKADWATIMALVYPVGSVVTLGVSTNPGTLYGVGTWTAITGKVIVGIAGSGTFDTLDGTGGAETVDSSHTHSLPYDGWGSEGAGSAGSLPSRTYADSALYAQGDNTSGSAGSATLDILQPYIVKYIWERVS